MPDPSQETAAIIAARRQRNNLPVSLARQMQAAKSNPYNANESDLDLVWGYGFEGSQAVNSYFDYFYSGEDVRVYIDGGPSTEQGNKLPIMQLAWNMQQEKRPLFGFWSYTFDAVLRGTRMVNGAFRIATTTPSRMRDILAEVASARAGQNTEFPIRDLEVDEQNIERYWTKNIDTSNYLNQSKNLWSAHPPFNFVIVYGIQDVSVSAYDQKVVDVVNRYTRDQALMTNENERLVEADSIDHTSRIVLEAIELTGVQVEYNTSGQICSEVYSFFGREVYTPTK